MASPSTDQTLELDRPVGCALDDYLPLLIQKERSFLIIIYDNGQARNIFVISLIDTLSQLR
jgi:hypothetical protein